MWRFSSRVLDLVKTKCKPIEFGTSVILIVFVVMVAFMEIFPIYYPHFTQQSFSPPRVEFKAFSDVLPTLKVVVYDAETGDRLYGAKVIVGARPPPQ